MVGYDDCVIWIVQRFGMEPVVLYDQKKVIDKLVSEGSSEEDALEWFSVNQLGSWNGEGTPAFASLMSIEEVREALIDG